MKHPPTKTNACARNIERHEQKQEGKQEIAENRNRRRRKRPRDLVGKRKIKAVERIKKH